MNQKKTDLIFSPEESGQSDGSPTEVFSEPKRKRGRPKLTEEQKAEMKAKRDAGKTKKFSVGDEPNKRRNV